MRSDLDHLMSARNIDAFFIPGTEGENTYRDYITGGVHASAMVVKKRDEAPVLIVSGMERDEAAKSGLQVMTYDAFNIHEIYKEHGRGTDKATAALWDQFITQLGVSGRVTFYGSINMQSAIKLLNTLKAHGSIEIVEDQSPDIFAEAYQTKDPDELEALRDVGARTASVLGKIRDWLSGHREEGGQVVNADGSPLTIGAVKRQVRLILLEHDLEDAEGMIFAQGRDGGVPHSRGESDEGLRPGEAIVFDLFPRPVGGGYFHDVTRTWSLGHARADVQRDFNLVLDVFHRSLEAVELGRPTKEAATQVCQWFEAAGHPTQLSTPGTDTGYVHSLGHGIGLNVHESPGISHQSPEKTIFKAGNVVTIEPGLYYPDKGYGIRVEDSVYLDENGHLHNLTNFPYDLVIPLNG
jgi:Xaa-Pro aminopeptidase